MSTIKQDIELQQIDNMEKQRKKLDELKIRIDEKILNKFQCYQKYVHIKGMNDLLCLLREWLVLMGTEVTVEGEEWIRMGLNTSTCPHPRAIIVDSKCEWIDELYQEYYDTYMKENMTQLKALLSKPYVSSTEQTENILFFIASYSYFVDSISPLIFRYLQSSKRCVIVFPVHSMKEIEYQGYENLEKMIKILNKIEAAGGECYCGNEHGLYLDRYEVCFLCSEYSGRLHRGLRAASKYVVSLQTTALYTHCYWVKGSFEETFSDHAKEEIDYLAASNYIADWICQRDAGWNKKILRVGYPKLDLLYHALHSEIEIPEFWKEKANGKKVILFTGLEDYCLDVFARNEVIVIWRMHPIWRAHINTKKYIDGLMQKYQNVILDTRVSYYEAFKLSDALVGCEGVSSIFANYLYTGKPICLYSQNHREFEINYRKEAWYNSAYYAIDEAGVEDFVKMIVSGNDFEKEKKDVYRKQVVDHFDGEVSNRIYSFFEDLKKE